jgi:hypothetical protein
MSEFIHVVQNDTKPDLYFQLIQKNNDAIYPLASKTVKAKFRLQNASSSLWEATCSNVWASRGICRLVWPSGALNVDAGSYEIEIYVEDPSSNIQTVLDIIDVNVKAEFGAVSS